MDGLTHNIWIDFVVLPAVFAFILTYIFRGPVSKFQEWAGGRKKEYKTYETDKTFQDKIREARIKEIVKTKEKKETEEKQMDAG